MTQGEGLRSKQGRNPDKTGTISRKTLKGVAGGMPGEHYERTLVRGNPKREKKRDGEKEKDRIYILYSSWKTGLDFFAGNGGLTP